MSPQPGTAVADGRTTVYEVSGVGSARCEGIVTEVLSELDGMLSVDVDIGTGRVTVTTAGESEDGVIAAAIH
ncbi:heavy-metal-associated domain-containing protein [Streptomyces sp. CA-250714]|uniref:heavy-metal-associated domain-containing protein n=1 Tax=Streptomyces sp. CA-250714 TaxID=3240060 RepID=UPI003D8C2473